MAKKGNNDKTLNIRHRQIMAVVSRMVRNHERIMKAVESLDDPGRLDAALNDAHEQHMRAAEELGRTVNDVIGGVMEDSDAAINAMRESMQQVHDRITELRNTVLDRLAEKAAKDELK